MQEIKIRIQQLKNDFSKDLSGVKTLSDLEAVRIAYLGRNGSIIDIMALLKDMSIDEKKVIAPLLNDLKQWVQDLYQTTKTSFELQNKTQEAAKKLNFDVTAYKRTNNVGSLHIFTKIVEQLEDIFISMGYEIATWPGSSHRLL